MPNSLGIDPKKFKHVRSDAKSTTLQHKDGHTLTIAHNVLSPKMKNQLMALSKMGQEAQTSGQAQEAQDQQKRKAYAEGPEEGMVSEQDGAPVVEEPQAIATPEIQAPAPVEGGAKGAGRQMAEVIKTNPRLMLMDEAAKGMGKGIKNTVQGVGNFVSGLTEGFGEEQPKAPVMSKEEAAMKALEQQAQPASDQIANAPQAIPPETPDSMAQAQNNMMGDLAKAKGLELAGAKDAAAAVGEKAKAEQQALQQNVIEQNKAVTMYQSALQSLTDQQEHIRADIEEGHIDPEKFWTGGKDGHGSHSKIATGLGIILAGFNPTNNPNAAINFLKMQMEQNLDAQKANLSSKNNLLRANLEQFKNIKDATDMTRLQQAGILHAQMMQAAAKAASPMAKAEMESKAGLIYKEYAPLAQRMAMTQAMMRLADGSQGDPSDTRAAEHLLGYMRMQNPEMAKEMETRLVPGVGMAKVPVPNDARKEITAHTKLEQALADLDAFTRTHTTLVPGTKEYNVGAQKSMIVQTMLREGLLNTVYREGEQPLLDKLIKSNPGNFLKEYNTLPQIKELQRNNAVQGNSLRDQYGLPNKKAPVSQGSNQSAQTALAWAKANPKDPRSAAILKRLGQ